MKFKIRIPKKVNLKQAREFFRKLKFDDLLIQSKAKELGVNEEPTKRLFRPELLDLFRIYKFITLNKRIQTLEFGCGWSTLIICCALQENKKKYSKQVKNLRMNSPFQHSLVDTEKKYINKTFNRVKKFIKINKSNLKTVTSGVSMVKYNGKIACEYDQLPLVNPDFIYVDGPNPFVAKGKISGITSRHKDIMPMSCDLLKIEHYLTPGTIVLFDGRTANARYLKANFQRKWQYIYDKNFDQNIFYLDEKPLGKHNLNQIKFYNSKK